MKSLNRSKGVVLREMFVGLLLGGLLVLAIVLSIGTAVFVYQGL